jgi:hypothetical protein
MGAVGAALKGGQLGRSPPAYPKDSLAKSYGYVGAETTRRRPMARAASSQRGEPKGSAGVLTLKSYFACCGNSGGLKVQRHSHTIRGRARGLLPCRLD